MTVKAKLLGRLDTAAASGLAPAVPDLYDHRGARRVAVVELHAVERGEPAPDSDRDPVVKLEVSALEVGHADHEDTLRAVLRALYVIRTATGTLDAAGDIAVADSTLADAAGDLALLEAARLRTALTAIREQALRAVGTPELSLLECRLELERLADRVADILMYTGGAE